MQGSGAGRLRDPRVPRIPQVAVLACWALGALVFVFVPQGSESKSVIATLFSLSASREAEFRISRPYDELTTLRGESPPGAADFLRQRLRKFEEYFGVKTHDDIQASLGVLNPAETAALLRVFVEAFWNVAKHSGAANMYLESRRVGSVLIARVRDDGQGFDTGRPPQGLEYMRRRAGEVGADLDVISTQGRGTSVQVRFRKRENAPNP